MSKGVFQAYRGNYLHPRELRRYSITPCSEQARIWPNFFRAHAQGHVGCRDSNTQNIGAQKLAKNLSTLKVYSCRSPRAKKLVWESQILADFWHRSALNPISLFVWDLQKIGDFASLGLDMNRPLVKNLSDWPDFDNFTYSFWPLRSVQVETPRSKNSSGTSEWSAIFCSGRR